MAHTWNESDYLEPKVMTIMVYKGEVEGCDDPCYELSIDFWNGEPSDAKSCNLTVFMGMYATLVVARICALQIFQTFARANTCHTYVPVVDVETGREVEDESFDVNDVNREVTGRDLPNISSLSTPNAASAEIIAFPTKKRTLH